MLYHERVGFSVHFSVCICVFASVGTIRTNQIKNTLIRNISYGIKTFMLCFFLRRYFNVCAPVFVDVYVYARANTSYAQYNDTRSISQFQATPFHVTEKLTEIQTKFTKIHLTTSAALFCVSTIKIPIENCANNSIIRALWFSWFWNDIDWEFSLKNRTVDWVFCWFFVHFALFVLKRFTNA